MSISYEFFSSYASRFDLRLLALAHEELLLRAGDPYAWRVDLAMLQETF